MTNETQQRTAEELWEPEMPMIWLVEDTKRFGVEGKTSERDRPIDVRLSYQEWLAIFLDGLGIDRTNYISWASKRVVIGQSEVATFLSDIGEGVPEYPMLSRIRSPYHDVIFEHDELEDLHKECLRVKSSTKNALALKGLDKLIHACDQARQLGLSIYFVSN